MSELPAAPAGAPGGAAGAAGGGPRGGPAARWSAVGRLVSGRPVRWGFVAVTVGLGAFAVAREWPDVRAALARLGLLTAAAALASVLAAMLAAMQVWRRLLAALGSPLPARAAARIMFVGQLGKYLPGSIWPVVAQMEMGNAHQVPRHRSASASVLTMLLSLLTGLLTALATLPLAGRSTPYLWAFLAAPILLVFLHPRTLNSVLGRLLRLARRPPLEAPLTGRAIAGASAWAFASWILYGLQIWLLAARLGAPAGKAALLAVGGFAFAWSAGFLVVFAPAGAGVRDVLLVAALGPALGVAGATAVALVSRALMTAGDLLTAAVAAGFSRPPPAEGEGRADRRGEPGRERRPAGIQQGKSS
jgi:glycosyltransferase 2 family protein